MKIKVNSFLMLIVGFYILTLPASSQDMDLNKKRNEALNALTTIDSNLVDYFPRWVICESDLNVKLKHVFKLFGKRPEKIEGSQIRVTAAPKPMGEEDKEFALLLIQWGHFSKSQEQDRNGASYVTLSTQEIAALIPEAIRNTVSGKWNQFGEELDVPTRAYCYIPIDPKEEPTEEEVREMVNYFQPTTKNHAISISAYEQAIKLGQEGKQIWLSQSTGNDVIGLPFWSAGEGRVQLHQIAIRNDNPTMASAIPSILALRLGFGYRISAGLPDSNGLLDFINSRRLDAGPGGKLSVGLDFNLPSHEQFGFTFNIEMPLRKLGMNNQIGNLYSYAVYANDEPGRFDYEGYKDSSIYLLRTTGQAGFFYNYWPDADNASNFLRFDLGVSYANIQESALYRDPVTGNTALVGDLEGLRNFEPRSASDWLYAKIEYLNQSGRPFGLSLQYSNQMLMSRVFVPVIGDWLYIEAKYAYNTRSANELAKRPFDFESMFMLSPVLRFAL
jgi:hypothetical protein